MSSTLDTNYIWFAAMIGFGLYYIVDRYCEMIENIKEKENLLAHESREEEMHLVQRVVTVELSKEIQRNSEGVITSDRTEWDSYVIWCLPEDETPSSEQAKDKYGDFKG